MSSEFYIMADPFKEILDQVIDYAVEGPPDYRHLESLLAYLSHDHDKDYALDRGLASSLLQHYKGCVDDEAQVDTRLIIVKMLTHLATVKKCRDQVFDVIGLDKLLLLFEDPSERVRVQACEIFRYMLMAPDGEDFMLKDRVVVDALTSVLLKDVKEVSLAAVPVLSALCVVDCDMSAETIDRLVVVLHEFTTNVQENERKSVRICSSVLRCVWNVCRETKEKETAIECKVVPAVAPFLTVPDNHTRRLAAGVLSAISVAERGKLSIIDQAGVVDALCNVALDLQAERGLRDNAVMTIQNLVEAPSGLQACGLRLMVAESGDILNEILLPHQSSRIIASLIKSKEHESNALQALHLLVQEAPGRKAAWDVLDIVPTLHSMTLGADNQRMRGLSRRSLEALCQDNPLAQAELDKLAPLVSEEFESGMGKGTLPASQTALVLVHCQNEYTTKAGLLHHYVVDSMEESQMLWNSVDLVEKARRQGVSVFYLAYTYEAELESADPTFGHLKTIVDAKAFVKGSWGAEITQELTPEGDDVVIHTTSCLSGFDGTSLEKQLRALGVTNVVVAGLPTDGAVEKTIREAYERGFNVFAMTDCTAASSSRTQEALMEQVLPTFSQPLTHNQLLNIVSSQ